MTSRGVHLSVLAAGLASLSLVASLGLASSPLPAEAAYSPTGPSIHSSDGVVGPIAAPVPPARRGKVSIDKEKGYRVAPGLHFRRWDQTDSRGGIRAYLLTANLGKPGLKLKYAAPGKVPTRRKLTKIMSRQKKSVAGVNGDFFDIADTGAPLGVGVSDSKPWHGPGQNWDLSFILGKDGTPEVRRTPMRAWVKEHRDLELTNVNSPFILAQGIGVYTPRWGKTPGYATVDGARKRDVRQVLIQEGVVVSNRRAVTEGEPIVGKVLIGRGAGAAALKSTLPVGADARVLIEPKREPRLAISGSTRLLRDGRRVTDDDGELHPRTAVGIDVDGKRLLLLVVDGRQKFSRGYTLVELARMLKKLGSEEALNLDGGGSSTMVTQRPSGRVRVANSPSDGHQRLVPNGLQLVYREPK